MRGWYRILAGENPAAILELLGLREGFYAAPDELARDFVFETGVMGPLVGVKTELGENLLTYAKLQGLLRLKRDRQREAQES